MIEQDSIHLLRECDAGVKMGISAITEVMQYAADEKLKTYLEKALEDNITMQRDLQQQLEAYHDEGKEPNLAAKGMSWLKTNVKLAMDASDQTIAELISEGCSMGVQSLTRYLNEYEAADAPSKVAATRLIGFQTQLEKNMREFL